MKPGWLARGAMAAALILPATVGAQNVPERLQQAQAAVQKRAWRRAMQLLEGARGNTVDEAAAILHMRGLAEAGLGEPQQAAGDLQRAYELNPQGRFYAGDAGLALLRANAAEAASRALEVAAQAEPRNPRLWQALAVANLRMGRNQAAAAAARRAIEVAPPADAANHYLRVAQALGNDGEIPAALTAARAAAATAPTLPNAHLAIGILLAQRVPPRVAGAAEEFLRAEALAPRFAPAYLQLGKLRLQQSRLADAVRQLERAQELAPAEEEALYLLAQAYARQGNAVKAHSLMSRYEAARRQRRQQLANQPLPTFIVR